MASHLARFLTRAGYCSMSGHAGIWHRSPCDGEASLGLDCEWQPRRPGLTRSNGEPPPALEHTAFKNGLAAPGTVSVHEPVTPLTAPLLWLIGTLGQTGASGDYRTIPRRRGAASCRNYISGVLVRSTQRECNRYDRMREQAGQSALTPFVATDTLCRTVQSNSALKAKTETSTAE